MATIDNIDDDELEHWRQLTVSQAMAKAVKLIAIRARLDLSAASVSDGAMIRTAASGGEYRAYKKIYQLLTGEDLDNASQI